MLRRILRRWFPAFLMPLAAIAAPLPLADVASPPDSQGRAKLEKGVLTLSGRTAAQKNTFYIKGMVRLSKPADLSGKALEMTVKAANPNAIIVFAVRAHNRGESKPALSHMVWRSGALGETARPCWLWDDGGTFPVNNDYRAGTEPTAIDRIEFVIGSTTPDQEIGIEVSGLAAIPKEEAKKKLRAAVGDEISFAVNYKANIAVRPEWTPQPRYADAPADVRHPVGIGRRFNAERVRANIKRFPWVKSIVDDWRRNARYWMSLDDEAIRRKIPAEDAFFKCLCPKCGLEPEFAWKALEPDGESIRCTRCKTLFPNPDYPETSTYTITRRDGTVKTVHYYHGPDQHSVSGENWGPRYHLTGVINYRKTADLGTIQGVALLYALEKKPEYAAKVRDVLLRYAEVYPGFDVKFRATMYPTPEGHYMAGKRCAWKFHDSSLMPYLLTAYTLTVPSGCYTAADRVKIENGIFREYLWTVMAYPPTGDYCSNAAPAHMCAAAYCGVVLGDHEAVDWALKGPDGLLSFVRRFYYRNGAWHEGTASYAGMANGPLETILLVLQGYSDPPSYRGPDRYQNLDLFRLAPEFTGILKAVAPGRLPTGKLPAVNDSGMNTAPSLAALGILADLQPTTENRELMNFFAAGGDLGWRNPILPFVADPKTPEKAPLPAALRSGTIVPGFNWAILRRPATADKAATVLAFPVQTSHSHYTMLNLIMCEEGREIVNDLGYLSCWHESYGWIGSPAAHNIVTVNDQPQGPNRRGEVEFFHGRGDGVQAMRIAAKYPFRIPIERYARTIVDVPLENGRRCTVDLFEVRGGIDHTWTFHADGALTAEGVDLRPGALPPVPGARTLTNARAAEKPATFARFDWSDDYGTTRVTALPDKPSMFSAGIGFGQRDQAKAYEKIDLHVLFERNAGGTSDFLHLIEYAPKGSGFAVTEARRLALPDGVGAAFTAEGTRVEVECRRDGRIVVRRQHGSRRETWETGAQLSGKVLRVDAARGKVWTDCRAALPADASFAGCALQIRRTADGTYLLAGASRDESGRLVFTLAPGENCRIEAGDEWISQPVRAAR